MLEPLKKFFCDVCGDLIQTPEEGYVIWRQDADGRDYDFKIIHQKKCDKGGYPSSLPLTEFLGDRGLAVLMAHLSVGPIKNGLGQKSGKGPKDIDEFVDFLRRVQTPYYEEARQLFTKPELIEAYDDANEVMPYLPEYLKRMIEKHG